MPNEKKGGPARSYLEQMSTEELERLLYQDVVSSRMSEPDPTYIKAIMEVIEKREAQAPADPLADLDVEAAWHVFQADYQGRADAFESAYSHDGSSHHPNQIIKPKKTARWPKVLRTVAIVAAILVALGSAASALGFNVFQAVASWTAEVFGFAERDVVQQDPFQELRNTVAVETNLSVIPKWAPENTRSVAAITSREYSYGKKVQEAFETESGSFYITINIYLESQEMPDSVYQKDDDTVIEHPVNEVIHYIMDNNGNPKVAWKNENVTVCIQGDLSIDDMARMVDSIYEE